MLIGLDFGNSGVNDNTVEHTAKLSKHQHRNVPIRIIIHAIATRLLALAAASLSSPPGHVTRWFRAQKAGPIARVHLYLRARVPFSRYPPACRSVAIWYRPIATNESTIYSYTNSSK